MKVVSNFEGKGFLFFRIRYEDTNQTLVWEFNMEKANGTPIYWLGQSLGQLFGLLSASEPIQIPIMINAAIMARSNLTVFTNIEGLPLSKGAALPIIANIDNLFSHLNAQVIGSVNAQVIGSAPIPPSEQQKRLLDQEKGLLIGSILHFQSVLSSELPQINIFYVAPHRAYNMDMLINNGENLLSPVTLKRLGSSKEEVVKDIREAARCLAFDFSTAVGFHLYRAVEAIIVEDYFPAVNVLPKEVEGNKNLGHYVKVLEERKIDVKITSILRHLKDQYRNPIMHPDEFWDSEKANSAIGLAVSIIDMIVTEIEEVKKRGIPRTNQ